MNFYNLPHIFVVFHPGSGGNFLCNLIRDIQLGESDSLNILPSGSAHTQSAIERNNMNFTIRFNRILDSLTHHNLVELDDRLEVYKDHVKEIANKTDQIQVSWTHDYTNIELYKAMFPNSKIVVISVDSEYESMASSLFQVNKNQLSNSGFVFVDDNVARMNHNKRVANLLIERSGILDKCYFLEIANRGREEKYRPLYEAFSVIDDMKRMEYIIGPSYKDNITDECFKVRFSDILNKNADAICSTLEFSLGRNINDNEREYIVDALDNYVSKQNQNILKDPLGYWDDLLEKAEDILDEVSEEYYS